MTQIELRPGDVLRPGQWIERGAARLTLSTDGNLVLAHSGKPVWATHTKGATAFTMRPDGNAVLSAGPNMLWSSKTEKNPGSTLALDPAGRFIIYKPIGGGKVSPIWDSKRRPSADGLHHESSALLPDPLKMVKSLGSAVGAVAHGKLKKSVQSLGAGVNQITGSAIIQAGFPVVAPANIVNGAVTGGKAGALKAAQAFLKNPIAKATYGAIGLVFPPLAPVSAGMVAGMEASSRLLDGLNSGDPKAVAAAALALAVTASHAAAGVPGAQRAMDLIEKTGKAGDLAALIAAGDGHAIKAAELLKHQAASGDKKAQAAQHLLTAKLLRETASGKLPQKAAIHGAARQEAPTLLAQVHAAMSSPHGLKIGSVSVLRTGRILEKGKSLPHKSQHKSKKAYDAYAKAHGGHHVTAHHSAPVAHKATGGGLHPTVKLGLDMGAHLPR